MELSFGEIGEWLHVEIAGAIEPFLVLLGGEGADEAQAARVVGEDAHDEGAAFEFLVEAFEQVDALEVFVMGLREALEGEVSSICSSTQGREIVAEHRQILRENLRDQIRLQPGKRIRKPRRERIHLRLRD